MTEHRIPVVSGKHSTAPPRLVIVQDCAPGDGWTIDMVDNIMRHVRIGDFKSMQRGVAIIADQLSFNEIRRRAFRAAWKDWVDHYNSGETKLRILVQDAHRDDLYCVFGPRGAQKIIEVTIFDSYFFSLTDGPFRQESCGQQLLRWDAFFTTIFPTCETTLTMGSSLKHWLTYDVSLTEQGPCQQEVVLLREPQQITYHRLRAPLSKAC